MTIDIFSSRVEVSGLSTTLSRTAAMMVSQRTPRARVVCFISMSEPVISNFSVIVFIVDEFEILIPAKPYINRDKEIFSILIVPFNEKKAILCCIVLQFY